MGKVVGGMTLSLDGFASDSHDDVSRLYPDLEELRNTEMLQEVSRAHSVKALAQNDHCGIMYLGY